MCMHKHHIDVVAIFIILLNHYPDELTETSWQMINSLITITNS